MVLRLIRGACCAVALLAGVPAFAQTPAALSPGDLQFVSAAAIGGQFEVEAGKLAARSTNGRVKAFGERMVRDHSAAGTRLAALVKGHGTLPKGLDAEHQQERDRLAALKGEEFDRAYISLMVKDHDADTKAFSDEERSAADPRLKQFVEQTLTMVKEHDQLARQIAGTLGLNPGPNPASTKG
jgi:putative membrane protein